MEQQSIFRNISPLDHRYYLSNREVFDKLADTLSEEASIRYCVRVEAALLRALVGKLLHNPEPLLKKLDGIEKKIDPEAVYLEEEKTHHNIRALVHVMKNHVPPETAHLVHLGATSVDILDTARAMRIRDAVIITLVPLLKEVENLLIGLTQQEAKTVQVGRTHGQHAVPVTLGYAFSEYVSRLGKSIIRMQQLAKDLRGKFSGAVGAYNATSVLLEDPEGFERSVLSELGLTPSDHATQLVEPEHLLRLLLEVQTAFGILANLADDLRNLQRSEIDEVREMFTSDQVGSSTMPQKRNPWNSEHVKSLWKTAAPMVMTFYMDQISEHQRDLTNSASSRFVSDYLALFAAAANRMKKVLSTLHVQHEKIQENLSSSGDLVLAEAAYIILAAAGATDAHEVIKKATLQCQSESLPLVEVLRGMPSAWERITEGIKATANMDAEVFFSNPACYTGLAGKRAVELAQQYSRSIKNMEDDT